MGKMTGRGLESKAESAGGDGTEENGGKEKAGGGGKAKGKRAATKRR